MKDAHPSIIAVVPTGGIFRENTRYPDDHPVDEGLGMEMAGGRRIYDNVCVSVDAVDLSTFPLDGADIVFIDRLDPFQERPINVRGSRI